MSEDREDEIENKIPKVAQVSCVTTIAGKRLFKWKLPKFGKYLFFSDTWNNFTYSLHMFLKIY